MMKNRGRLTEPARLLTWPGAPPRHAPRARISNNYMKWLRSEGHFLKAWVEMLIFRLDLGGLRENLMKNIHCKLEGSGSDTPLGRWPGEFIR